MKILTLAPYISFDRIPELSRSKSGLGYLVFKIVNGFGKKSDIFSGLLTQANLTKEQDVESVHLYRHKMIDVLRHSRLCYIADSLKMLRHLSENGKMTLNIMLYFWASGHAEWLIKKEKPDIVHIHSITYYTLGYIQACIRTHTPFVITAHGLLSLDASISVSQHLKQIEQATFRWTEKNGVPISVISTGIKKRIEQEIIGHPASSITVITNGVEVEGLSKTVSGSIGTEKLAGRQLFSCIGNISERKSQHTVLEALALMDDTERSKIGVIFAGNDDSEHPLIEQAKALHIEDAIIFLGAIPNTEIGQVYLQASYNVLASKSEGFGLSIAEAYAYGIPTVCFYDIDAIADLYNESSMLLVQERSAESLKNAMLQMTQRTWDRAEIRAFSKRFSLEAMTEAYIHWYSAVKPLELNEKEFKKIF